MPFHTLLNDETDAIEFAYLPACMRCGSADNVNMRPFRYFAPWKRFFSVGVRSRVINTPLCGGCRDVMLLLREWWTAVAVVGGYMAYWMYGREYVVLSVFCGVISLYGMYRMIYPRRPMKVHRMEKDFTTFKITVKAYHAIEEHCPAAGNTAFRCCERDELALQDDADGAGCLRQHGSDWEELFFIRWSSLDDTTVYRCRKCGHTWLAVFWQHPANDETMETRYYLLNDDELQRIDQCPDDQARAELIFGSNDPLVPESPALITEGRHVYRILPEDEIREIVEQRLAEEQKWEYRKQRFSWLRRISDMAYTLLTPFLFIAGMFFGFLEWILKGISEILEISGSAFPMENGKYGMYDSAGGYWNIEPKYDRLFFICEDCYRVKLGGQYGLVDRNGKPLLSIEYDMIKHYRGSYLLLRKGKFLGLFNITGGSVVFPAEYDVIKRINRGGDFIVRKEGRWYPVIGDIVLRESSRWRHRISVTAFKDVYVGHMRVGIQGRFGIFAFFNVRDWLVPPEYRKRDLAMVATGDHDYYGDHVILRVKDKYGIVREGEFLVAAEYDNIERCGKCVYIFEKKGLFDICVVQRGMVMSGRPGAEREARIEPRYQREELSAVSDGHNVFSIVRAGTLYGLIDITVGRWMLPIQYHTVTIELLAEKYDVDYRSYIRYYHVIADGKAGILLEHVMERSWKVFPEYDSIEMIGDDTCRLKKGKKKRDIRLFGD